MNNASLIWMIAAAAMLLMAGAVGAGEIYQYTDKEGNLIFTDDYNRVPQENQDEVKIIQSVESKPHSSAGEQAEPPVMEPENVTSAGPAPSSKDQISPSVDDSGSEDEKPESDTDTYAGEKESADGASLDEASDEASAEVEADSELVESSDYEVTTGRVERRKNERDRQLNRSR
jgi:hypothetical protein